MWTNARGSAGQHRHTRQAPGTSAPSSVRPCSHHPATHSRDTAIPAPSSARGGSQAARKRRWHSRCQALGDPGAPGCTQGPAASTSASPSSPDRQFDPPGRPPYLLFAFSMRLRDDLGFDPGDAVHLAYACMRNLSSVLKTVTDGTAALSPQDLETKIKTVHLFEDARHDPDDVKWWATQADTWLVNSVSTGYFDCKTERALTNTVRSVKGLSGRFTPVLVCQDKQDADLFNKMCVCKGIELPQGLMYLNLADVREAVLPGPHKEDPSAVVTSTLAQDYNDPSFVGLDRARLTHDTLTRLVRQHPSALDTITRALAGQGASKDMAGYVSSAFEWTEEWVAEVLRAKGIQWDKRT